MYATDTSKCDNMISDDDSSLFSPRPSLFLPQHCNQRPFAPSCIFVSFISAHTSQSAVSKSSYQLRRGETTFASVCSLSFSLPLPLPASRKMLSLSNFSSNHTSSRRDSSLLSRSFSLPKSSHVRRVTGQMCHSTVDERLSVS